jgi:hypothetical protein
VFAPDLKAQIAQDRTKELAARYNDELERTKYTGFGGVKTNNTQYGDTGYDIELTQNNIRKW